MMQDTWQRLKADRYGMTGLVVVLIFFAVALCVWSGLILCCCFVRMEWPVGPWLVRA